MIPNLIDFNDILPYFDELYGLSMEIYSSPGDFSHMMENKLLATLFYEPSTRTQFSFQAAMYRLGGKVIGFSDANSSSVSKGETLSDTVKIVSGYSDFIVIRHPVEGAAYAASLYSGVPVINAGDGGHFHPTQTIADLITVKKEKSTLSGLKIGICGDLKNGRTVHSLIRALSEFKGNEFYLISTAELDVPKYIKDYMKVRGIIYHNANSINECIETLDILYMTRIQKERFVSIDEYNSQAGLFILDEDKLVKAKNDLLILHPLPRVDEIHYNVDRDLRAFYFKQAEYGMYGRMALLLLFDKYLTLKNGFDLLQSNTDMKCINPRCIVNHEKNLPNLSTFTDGGYACSYCEHSM